MTRKRYTKYLDWPRASGGRVPIETIEREERACSRCRSNWFASAKLPMLCPNCDRADWNAVVADFEAVGGDIASAMGEVDRLTGR